MGLSSTCRRTFPHRALSRARNTRQTQGPWHLLKGDIWIYDTEWDISARTYREKE